MDHFVKRLGRFYVDEKLCGDCQHCIFVNDPDPALSHWLCLVLVGEEVDLESQACDLWEGM